MNKPITASPGQWVEIRREILPAGQRAPQVPAETQKVPLTLRAKGFLNSAARSGEEVEITTVIGRKISGTLVDVAPCYTHDYGEHISALAKVGTEVRHILRQCGDGGETGA